MITEQEMNLRMNGAVRLLYEAHGRVAEANCRPQRWAQQTPIEQALDTTRAALHELEEMVKYWQQEKQP